MIDSDLISNKWREDEPKLKKLGEDIVILLKNELSEKELRPEITYRTKELPSLIKKLQKKQKKNSSYTYENLTDKLGVRIVCSFLSDLDIVEKSLYKNFKIIKADKKKDTIDFNKLDYQSNHYDVSMKNEKIDFVKNLIFEIQVRTLNQNAWANSAHILYYKQDIILPDEMKHKIYRLLSLYELADEEFTKVNQYLIGQKDNIVYTLLRKLEGKIYKFAHTDFDREMSVENLNIIIDFFTKEQQKNIEENILLFIDNAQTKIAHIYEDNKSRYNEIQLLTQPEIFIIWYGIDKFPFNITDNWADNFAESELETISSLWK